MKLVGDTYCYKIHA